jgi:tetratricopeptide (TPR) repeat protein
VLVHEPAAPTLERKQTVSSPSPRGPEILAPGDSEEIVGYARLLEIRRRRMGEGHASVAELLEKIGLALRSNGQVERASQCLMHALEIHQSREPPAPRATARLLGQLAECDLMLDRPHAVVARLEQAERLLRTTLATAAELGGVRLLLSQVLWRLGQRDRSIALARLAQQSLASGGSGGASSLQHGARAWMRSITTQTVDDRGL